MDDIDASIKYLNELKKRDPEGYEAIRKELVTKMNADNEKFLAKYGAFMPPPKIKFKRSWWKK